MTRTQQVTITIAYPNEEAAQTASEELVGLRLAACGQVSRILSTYRWNDEIVSSEEYLLTLKTSAECLNGIADYVGKTHEYEVSEIIATPVLWAEERYSAWIEENVQKKC